MPVQGEFGEGGGLERLLEFAWNNLAIFHVFGTVINDLTVTFVVFSWLSERKIKNEETKLITGSCMCGKKRPRETYCIIALLKRITDLCGRKLNIKSEKNVENQKSTVQQNINALNTNKHVQQLTFTIDFRSESLSPIFFEALPASSSLLLRPSSSSSTASLSCCALAMSSSVSALPINAHKQVFLSEIE
jgi:hypothetical protein